MKNSMRVIHPFFDEGTWVFGDPAFNLVREPFVSGIPEIIDRVVSGIPDAKDGFRLLFSGSEFPGAMAKLERVSPECGGFWYRLSGTEMLGWLCPAMFHYFEEAPEFIFVRAEQIKE